MTKQTSGTTHFRWMICAILFLAMTINYIDRQVISILKPMIITWDGWSELAYGQVVGYFQLAYAIAMIFAGAFVDRVGIKKGLAIAIVFWSLAAMGHALSGTVASFILWRVLLGIGEAASFPASIKAVATWFPKSQRALATGIFNSGTNVGAIVTAPAIAWILATFKGDWRMVFIMTGSIGFVWLVVWLLFYKKPTDHTQVSPAELAIIQSDPADPQSEKVKWLSLLGYKQSWAFAIGKFMTDPVWWVWLFWIPGFLKRVHHVDIKNMGSALLVIYTLASVGSIIGGWLPAYFLKKGWTVNAARKTAMLICALCAVPVVGAAFTHNLWVAVVLIGVACAAHQGWSANIFTTASDMFPKKAVGSVVGLGGFAGGMGGYIIANYVGAVLNKNPDNYLPVFLVACSMYLCALLIIQCIVPKLEPAKLA